MTTSRLYTGAARAVDAIPVVGTTAARDARYPDHPLNFRVQNLETGTVQRYTESGWTDDWAIGGTSIGWTNVQTSGVIGNGTTDDTTAMQTAIATAGADGVVFVPDGFSIKTTSALTMSYARQRWVFGAGAKILKSHTGNGVTISASGFEGEFVRIEGNTAVSATYAQGRGFYYDVGTDDSTLIRPETANIDNACEFAADGGKRCSLVVPHFEPYTTTAGSEGTIIKTGADTGAMQREIIGINGSGVVDVSGAQDMSFSGGSVRRPVMSSACFAVRFEGTLFGSSGQAMTFDGSSTYVAGCRCAGSITLASTFTGAFLGNPQTAGTFTDNTAANAAVVLHHPLTVDYWLLAKHKFMTGSTTGGLIRSHRRVSIGDASYTWDPVAGVSLVRAGTTLTADRTVTLTTTNAVDGNGCRVSRSGGGAFNLLVKSGAGGSTIATLATNEWADCEWNGSAYEVTAKGTL